jgi:DNA-binding NarL/FixJ family response regulator
MAIDLPALTGGIELASAAKQFLTKNDGMPDHSLGDRLSKALRTIYFPPTGILAFLREVERREKVTEDDVRKALISFNDREPQVEKALESLKYEELADELGLTIATVEVLNAIRYGKLNLRHEIQAEINSYGQRGYRPTPSGQRHSSPRSNS